MYGLVLSHNFLGLIPNRHFESLNKNDGSRFSEILQVFHGFTIEALDVSLCRKNYVKCDFGVRYVGCDKEKNTLEIYVSTEMLIILEI